MYENPTLAGKVALVTGASRGIGRGAAIELAALGAQVVVTARTASPRGELAGTIGETVGRIGEMGGAARAIQADLLADGAAERLAAGVIAEFGRVDVLINNAAYIGDAVFEGILDMSADSWRAMLELNVTVPWLLAKAFAPGMIRVGGGLIINLSSEAGNAPPPTVRAPLPGAGGLGAAYPTSKAALNQLTATVGNELRAEGVTMLAIDPGFTRSESAEILAARLGADPAWAQPVDVVARAIGVLARYPDPIALACRCFTAAGLADELAVLPAGA